RAAPTSRLRPTTSSPARPTPGPSPAIGRQRLTEVRQRGAVGAVHVIAGEIKRAAVAHGDADPLDQASLNLIADVVEPPALRRRGRTVVGDGPALCAGLVDRLHDRAVHLHARLRVYGGVVDRTRRLNGGDLVPRGSGGRRIRIEVDPLRDLG